MMDKIRNTLTIAQEPHKHKLVRDKECQYQTGIQYRHCPDPSERVITPAEFVALSHEEMLLIILGKQIGCPKAERHIDTYVKRFLQKAWKLRRPYVELCNKKYGRKDNTMLY